MIVVVVVAVVVAVAVISLAESRLWRAITNVRIPLFGWVVGVCVFQGESGANWLLKSVKKAKTIGPDVPWGNPKSVRGMPLSGSERQVASKNAPHWESPKQLGNTIFEPTDSHDRHHV